MTERADRTSRTGRTETSDRRRAAGESAEAHSDGVLDRRSGVDRRDMQAQSGRAPEGFDRRRGPGRRLSDFAKAAEDGELTREQFLFISAIDAFKRANHKTFPAWTEVLEVIRLMGYRKTARMEIELPNAEDWTESPDAPAGVRTITNDKAA